MPKRPRRRPVLESSEDDEENDGACLLPKCVGRIPELQKSCQQPRSPSETGTESRKKNARKKASHGTRPLEFVAFSPAIAVDCSGELDAETSAELGDHQNHVLEQNVNHRLWVDKYAPRDVGELAVHAKKVAEVREWLQGQLLEPYGPRLGSRVLILTGPAGAGKTAVVRTLADQLGIELCEWTAPAPELWHEYSHHAATGGPYVSKLDEFELFLERGRKMSALPLASNFLFTSQNVTPSSADHRNRKMSKVLIIDDIPVVNNEDHRQRIYRSLRRLALSRNIASIVVVTDEAGVGYRVGEKIHYETNVMEALEGGGAKKIAFNPVTFNAMKRLLSKIQLLERCKLPSASLSTIAESSAGDIRQALTSLQFLSAGCNSRDLHTLMWDPGGIGDVKFNPSKIQHSDSSSLEITQGSRSYAGVAGGRDHSLSLFHALGKFLHNKRRANEIFNSGDCSRLKLKEEFRRPPLDMEEPESVLLQAHSDTATVLAFLHENVLHFVDEDAADDVAVISAYLSDTDCLLGDRRSFRSRQSLVNTDDFEPSQVATAAANSVVTRGVLFGNGHPAPRRWQSLRAPGLWRVEGQKRLTKMEMIAQTYGSVDTRRCSEVVQAMELYPFSQLLSRHSPSSSLAKFSYSNESVNKEASKCDECDESEAQLRDEIGLKQGHSEFESSFMHLSVEDDIEDPDDSP